MGGAQDAKQGRTYQFWAGKPGLPYLSADFSFFLSNFQMVSLP
jgi:hypothetical protein